MQCDLWSLGIVIFITLVGYPPFQEKRQSELFRKIRCCQWKFVEEDWRHISGDAKALIRGLLVADPDERWTVQEALHCSWIRQDSQRLSQVSLSPSILSLKENRLRLATLARTMVWSGNHDSSISESSTHTYHYARAHEIIDNVGDGGRKIYQKLKGYTTQR